MQFVKEKWKLIEGTKSHDDDPRDFSTPGQLYDMETDPYEKKNLWDEHPEIVRQLTALQDRYK